MVLLAHHACRIAWNVHRLLNAQPASPTTSLRMIEPAVIPLVGMASMEVQLIFALLATLIAQHATWEESINASLASLTM